MKKIVICGSVSVGKTTVINCTKAVFEILNPMDRTLMNPGPKVGFVDEAAWGVFVAEPTLDRAAYTTDRKIINRVIELENIALQQEGVEVLVCDRSVLDSFVFARTHNGGHYNKLVEEFAGHLSTYDRFLLFDPYDVPHVTTDVRIEDKQFRTLLHKRFIETLNDYGLDWEVVVGPVSERVLRLMNEIL
jgi:nicotinamide riboside kinase